MALNTPRPNHKDLMKSADDPFDSHDIGGFNASTAADRRNQAVGPVTSEEGVNRAPSLTAPEPPLWKPGYLNPSSFLTAPYDPVYCEGDTSGAGTVIHEVDIDTYGDDYDPTAPIRVRQADNWHLDSDHDGHLN